VALITIDNMNPKLNVKYGFRVAQYAGIASAPAPRLVSEYTSARRWG
jgi:hypothetical protein